MIGLYNDPEGSRLLIGELCDQTELFADHAGTMPREATVDEWQILVDMCRDPPDLPPGTVIPWRLNWRRR